MRKYFDEEETDEAPEVEERTRDTEVTLTPGGLAGIFFGLILICGLCFGLGYWMGHRGPGPGPAAERAATPTAAPDEEPLQASGSIPKPSAAAQEAVPPAEQASDGTQTQAPATGGANPASPAAQPNEAGAGPAGSPSGSAAESAPPQVRPAMPSSPSPPQPAQAFPTPNVRAALPGPGQLMVQIAAVSHEEDANVLVNALRGRGYAVMARRDPSDGLIHVRIGPFTNRADANRMCRRLLDDGYNAFIQP